MLLPSNNGSAGTGVALGAAGAAGFGVAVGKTSGAAGDSAFGAAAGAGLAGFGVGVGSAPQAANKNMATVSNAMTLRNELNLLLSCFIRTYSSIGSVGQQKSTKSSQYSAEAEVRCQAYTNHFESNSGVCALFATFS
jgi:hypothetical protein